MRVTAAVTEQQQQQQQQQQQDEQQQQEQQLLQPEGEDAAAAAPPPPPSSPSPPPLSPPTPAPLPAQLPATTTPISPPPASPAAARSGPGLLARIAAASAAPRAPTSSSEARSSPGLWASLAPPGTRVWVLLRGKLGLKGVIAGAGGPGESAVKAPVAWPAVLFSMSRVPKADVPVLLQTFNPRASGGRALVLFYGERSLMWCRLADLEPWPGPGGDDENGGNGGGGEGAVASRLSALRASSSGPRVARRIALAAADAIREAGATLSDPERELERAARARAAGALAAATGGAAAAVGGGEEGTDASGGASAEQAAAAAPTEIADADPNVYCSLHSCRETISIAEEKAGSCVRCDRCGRHAHTLCLDPPALKKTDLTERLYDCPGCRAPFSPRGLDALSPSAAGGGAAGGWGASPATAGDVRGGRWGRRKLRCSGRAPPTQKQEERMGLTPDRIIEGAIRVFGLEPPTQVSF